MKFRSVILSMLAGGVLLAASGSVFSEGQKAISVQRSEAKPNGLQVSIETGKASFNVGEPIRFSVKGNKTFYLYVYGVDANSGESVLLLPNDIDKNNKYPANQSIKVPNPKVAFTADQAGSERFVLVASTRYISVDTARARQAGKLKVINTKSLEQAFADKGIFTRMVDRIRNKPEVFIKEFEIKIADAAPAETTAPASATPRPVVVVSTSRNDYQVGDKVRIVYGADQAGWLDLYLKGPDGKSQQIASQQISANQLLTLDAEAEAPKGKHDLEVVWRAADKADAASGKGARDKGLRLLDHPATKINATASFTIK